MKGVKEGYYNYYFHDATEPASSIAASWYFLTDCVRNQRTRLLQGFLKILYSRLIKQRARVPVG